MEQQTGYLCSRIVFGLIGVFALWQFYRFRTGKNKYMQLRWYRGDRWARGRSYGAPFFGLAGLILAFMEQIAAILSGSALGILFVGSVIIGIFAAIWQPNWLKPEWWRWIEQNAGDIIPLLRDDLIHNRRNPQEWNEWVNTQKGLEEWVNEVRRKQGLI